MWPVKRIDEPHTYQTPKRGEAFVAQIDFSFAIGGLPGLRVDVVNYWRKEVNPKSIGVQVYMWRQLAR